MRADIEYSGPSKHPSLRVLFLTIIIGGSLTTLASLTQTKSEDLPGYLFFLSNASLGILIGGMISLIYEYGISLYEYRRNLISAMKKNEAANHRILEELYTYQRVYGENEKLKIELSDSPHREIHRRLASEAMENHKVIPNKDAGHLVGLAEDLLEKSGSWKAIHKGSIEELIDKVFPQRDIAERFYKIVQKKQIVKKRILIFTSEDQIAKLHDNTVIKNFFELPGKGIDTFWIKEKDITDPYIKSCLASMGNCALYGDETLLQFDRKKVILSFIFDMNQRRRL